MKIHKEEEDHKEGVDETRVEGTEHERAGRMEMRVSDVFHKSRENVPITSNQLGLLSIIFLKVKCVMQDQLFIPKVF